MRMILREGPCSVAWVVTLRLYVEEAVA
eukprot:COSAG01_NODE_67573_length_266_cov_1.544910_1_plen_27_part_10